MNKTACAHCDEPLGSSRIECPGCKTGYHVECMAEIQSCTAPSCEGNLNQVLRQRSLSVQGGSEGFTLAQRSLTLVLVLGGLFASFTVVEKVTPAHGVLVIVVAVATFTVLNPELWAWFTGDQHAT